MREKTRWAIEQMAEIHHELDKCLKQRPSDEGVHAAFDFTPLTREALLVWTIKTIELRARDAPKEEPCEPDPHVRHVRESAAATGAYTWECRQKKVAAPKKKRARKKK